jgi:D-3-phosphoglycerate dehydrogenase
MNPKIFISTVPFGEHDQKPIELLKQTGWKYTINPLGRKLTAQEIGEFIKDYDGLIAGTENIEEVLKTAKKLKIISRVGIGLDSVPLELCRKKGISVSYTPDAVTKAVSEITIGAMISISRFIHQADYRIRNGIWNRLQGKRIGKSVIGIIGMGRIGTHVIELLSSFSPKEILVNDLKDKHEEIWQLREKYKLNIREVSKEIIYNESDIISLHVPFSPKTRGMVDQKVLKSMKKDSFLINYARGGIVNEDDLYEILNNQEISGAVIDVFEVEPYSGPLTKLKNIVLTQHMGSCSYDCRSKMEIQATEDLIRFFQGKSLHNEVPEEEYEYQR